MHIFAWSPNPYAIKPRRRPIATSIHGAQHIECILSDRHNRFSRYSDSRWRSRRWFLRPSISRERQRAERRRAHRRRRRMMDRRGASPLSSTELSTVTTAHVDLLGGSASTSQNFNRFRMGHSKWIILAFFITATALLLPAHLFLKEYPLNAEIIAVVFIITLIFIICFSVSMFHTRTRDILMHRYELENRLNGDSNRQSTRMSQNDPQQQFIANQLRLRRNRHIIRFRSTRSTPDLFQNGDIRHLRSSYGHRHGFTGRTPRSLSHSSRSSIQSGVHIPFGETRSDPSIRSFRSGEPPPYEVALQFPSIISAEEDSTETPPPSYDAL